MTDDLRARLNDALAPQYTIERELDGGGMSHVYVAMEHALGRRVVIKLLPPDLAAGVNRERFEREMQLAAQLQHPHIVPLLSAGQVERSLYYTMPFIEGESLRAMSARGGRMPVSDVVRILHDVVEALAYAHGKGVVHRDIKPGNVLTLGSHALVTDFGVAKAISVSLPHSGSTSTGMAIGTPAYMAPEQIAADPLADHRMDLYAAGLLAYELLSGEAPFASASPQETMAQQLTRMPDDLHDVRSDVPPALSTVIMRCLEKRPQDRPQSAEQLLALLDGTTTSNGERFAGVSLSDRTTQPAMSVKPRRRWPSGAALAASLLLVVAAAATAGMLLRDRPSAVTGNSAEPAAAPTPAGDSAANALTALPGTSTAQPPAAMTRAESLAIAEAVRRRLDPAAPVPVGVMAPESLIARFERELADSMASVSEALRVARALQLSGFDRLDRPGERDSVQLRSSERGRNPGAQRDSRDSRNAEASARVAPRILVLPTTSPSGTPQLEPVAALIADTLGALLLRHGLPVGRLSDEQRRAVRLRPSKVRELGYGLAVRSLVSLRRDSVAVVVQLMDTRSGRIARTIEGAPAPVGEPLRGMDRLAARTVEQIRALAAASLDRRQQSPRRTPPEERPEAKAERPSDR